MFEGMFDFNPLEPGDPLTLGFIETYGNKKFVDGYSTNPWYDDSEDKEEEDDDNNYHSWF